MSGIYFESILLIPLLLLSYFNISTILIHICILSTFRIIYNLNPFLRTDGYWILSDYLNIPNLRNDSMLEIKNLLMGNFEFLKEKKKMFLLFYGIIALTLIIKLFIFTIFKHPTDFIYINQNIQYFIKEIFLNKKIKFLFLLNRILIPLLFYYFILSKLIKFIVYNIKNHSFNKIVLLYSLIIGISSCSRSNYKFVNKKIHQNEDNKNVLDFKKSIEDMNFDSIKSSNNNENILLYSHNEILKYNLEDAENKLTNLKFSIADSENILSSDELLLFDIYFMQQQWDKIINFKKTEKNYSFLKSIAKFYSKFGKFEIKFPASQDSTKIIIVSDRHIIINIKINNKNYKFLFDTGSSDFLISKEISKELNTYYILDSTNTLNDNDIKKLKVHHGLLSEIKIGDIIVNNFPTYITDKIPKEFDGIIGWNLLKYFRIKINLKNKEVILYNNHFINNNKPNLFGNFLPLIKTDLIQGNKSKKIILLFDSGSDNSKLLADSNLILLSKGRFIGLRSTISGKSVFFYKKIKYGVLSFENNQVIEFRNLPLYFNKMKSQNVIVNGILGLDVFKNKIIDIDLSSNYFKVQDF